MKIACIGKARNIRNDAVILAIADLSPLFTVAWPKKLVRFEGAQQQEARMIKVYFSLDLEQLVLILIVARLCQRLM